MQKQHAIQSVTGTQTAV